MLELFGKQINKFDDIVNAVYDEIDEDPSLYCDCCGDLPTFDDIDDLHDFCESEFPEEEDYQEFCKILNTGKDDFEGIEFDTGDWMYQASGGGFSSYADYCRYRFG